MNKEQGERDSVVLAYSGGLDTSVLVRWLIEEKGLDVIAVTADLGQPGDMEAIRQKALDTGAVASEVVDAREVFASDFIVPSLWANAMYQGSYPLATALARPLIAKLQVESARRHGARFVAHGCTGKGNDQVRFEVASAALDPSLEVIAPMRELKMTREEEIDYARKWSIPVPVTVESPYSIDENLWGRSCECGVLEDPWVEPPEDAYQWTASPENAPGEPRHIEIGFESGVPVALDGEALSLVDMILRLNDIGGAHGVGRIDVIEDRLVGIKSREIYEAPAATILHFAHTELERLTLDKPTFDLKSELAGKYANLVYNGLWFSPLRNALDAFVDVTQRNVTGTVKVKLFKGNVIIAGRTSERSLYSPALATYTKEDTFDHTAAAGFIKIYGLPVKTYHQVNRDGVHKQINELIKVS